eukprot:932064-Prymnesium_polylepis.2
MWLRNARLYKALVFRLPVRTSGRPCNVRILTGMRGWSSWKSGRRRKERRRRFRADTVHYDDQESAGEMRHAEI